MAAERDYFSGRLCCVGRIKHCQGMCQEGLDSSALQVPLQLQGLSNTLSRVSSCEELQEEGSAGSPLLHSAVRALVSPRVPWAQEAGLSLAKCPKVPEVPTPRRWG